MQQVETITCHNSAAFFMEFSIRWIDSNGKQHTSSWSSGSYPVSKERTSPSLDELGVPADAVGVTPYVHAIAGNHNEGKPMVQYAQNGRNATYRVHGVTLSFQVDLES